MEVNKMSFSKMLGDKYIKNKIEDALPIKEIPNKPYIYKMLFVSCIQDLGNMDELYKKGYFNLKEVVEMKSKSPKLQMIKEQLLKATPDPYGNLRGFIIRPSLTEIINTEDPNQMAYEVARFEHNKPLKLNPSSEAKNGQIYFWGKYISAEPQKDGTILFTDMDAAVFVEKKYISKLLGANPEYH
jgi:hypothetical protein